MKVVVLILTGIYITWTAVYGGPPSVGFTRGEYLVLGTLFIFTGLLVAEVRAYQPVNRGSNAASHYWVGNRGAANGGNVPHFDLQTLEGTEPCPGCAHPVHGRLAS